MRRDIKKHNEWYWLNLYDENGEIGRQAEWEPETSYPKIFKSFLYNMFYKPVPKKDGVEIKMVNGHMLDVVPLFFQIKDGADEANQKDWDNINP